MIMGAILLQMLQRFLAFWQFCSGYQRILATLWKICQINPQGFGNTLKKKIPRSSLATFATKKNIFITGLQIPSDSFPERVDYFLVHLIEGLDNLLRHLQEGCHRNNQRGKLFAIPLQNQKAQIEPKKQIVDGQ
jgi:hypothetical protein